MATMLRFTKQRQAVLEVVQHSKAHPDAQGVYVVVKKTMPKISLGTVYRSLEALVADGFLTTIQRPGMPTRFDACLDNHYHLVCDHCGAVEDITLGLPDLLPLVNQAQTGFAVKSALVEFHGCCTDCLSKRH